MKGATTEAAEFGGGLQEEKRRAARGRAVVGKTLAMVLWQCMDGVEDGEMVMGREIFIGSIYPTQDTIVTTRIIYCIFSTEDLETCLCHCYWVEGRSKVCIIYNCIYTCFDSCH